MLSFVRGTTAPQAGAVIAVPTLTMNVVSNSPVGVISRRVTMLVPKADLAQGIALNSTGVNVSWAVWSWNSPPKERTRLPPERFGSAIRTGLRHARYNPHLGVGSALTIAAAGALVAVPLSYAHERCRPKTTHLIGVRPR